MYLHGPRLAMLVSIATGLYLSLQIKHCNRTINFRRANYPEWSCLAKSGTHVARQKKKNPEDDSY